MQDTAPEAKSKKNAVLRWKDDTEIATDEDEDLLDLEIPIGITPLQLD